MESSCTAEVVYWRGPAPFLFAVLPQDVAERIKAVAPQVSYGWGCIPVFAVVEGVPFATALFPRQGTYFLPLKVAARRQMRPIEVGDWVQVAMQIGLEGEGEMN